MNDEIFALVDCNSFYASCERVFNPKLKKTPVIVLSNNDGCVVTRTDEAKALGIKMGEPYFKVKELVQKNEVQVFSSNYALYADMSARVMKTLSEFTPDLKIYSIDEAFLSLHGFETRELTSYGKLIRQTVMQHTGIPVSIGIAPTKVLAKIGNKVAKKRTEYGGVFDLTGPQIQEEILANFDVNDIWGIGPQSTKKLFSLGIRTAKELRDASEKTVQKLLTIVGRRILSELKGTSCISLEMISENKKQIICSRSFGTPVFELSELKEAVAIYMTRAAERLRQQRSVSNCVQVFIHTNRFKNTNQYFNLATLNLLTGTSATNRLIATAFAGLEKIYRPGYEYKKAGVILMDNRKENQNQLSLFDQGQHNKDETVMKAMDRINKKIGRDMVKFAACGAGAGWKMLSQKRSPCFTTRWEDLLTVG